MSRFLALDWSGAAKGAHRSIRLAEARRTPEGDAVAVVVEGGRGRSDMVGYLMELAAADPELVLGIDFAFGFPHWFVEEHGIESGPESWRLAAREGERWLAKCPRPFWGRPGRRKPELPAHFRRTEDEVGAVSGIRPKSVFQIGGAGAVGTGSIRGMPFLSALAEAGWRIWPFHDPEPGHPIALEIWPRILSGAVRKNRAEERVGWIDEQAPSTPAAIRSLCAESEDAFDAVASAIGMARAGVDAGYLPEARDGVDRMEGRIWTPEAAASEVSAR